MTEESRPVRWRLTDLRATDDEARYAAVVSAGPGETREYLFVREDTTIGGRPTFMWDVGDWDLHTLFDRGSFKAVLDAVLAFYEASRREIALGDNDRREPSEVPWRLAGIKAAAEEPRYVAVIADPDGEAREYPFAREAVTIGGKPAFGWEVGDWDRDTLHDRASYKAVMNAVHAFYEARQREMALGDDEERKPPGL